jgi:hypothetical protein
VVGEALLPEWHDKPGTHAINLVRACLASRQNRGFSGLDRDDGDLVIVAAESLRSAAE